MQVEPTTLMLKAPGTKVLKLKDDKLPLSCGFKFNLRRYVEERAPGASLNIVDFVEPMVRRCRLN